MGRERSYGMESVDHEWFGSDPVANGGTTDSSNPIITAPMRYVRRAKQNGHHILGCCTSSGDVCCGFGYVGWDT